MSPAILFLTFLKLQRPLTTGLQFNMKLQAGTTRMATVPTKSAPTLPVVTGCRLVHLGQVEILEDSRFLMKRTSVCFSNLHKENPLNCIPQVENGHNEPMHNDIFNVYVVLCGLCLHHKADQTA